MVAGISNVSNSKKNRSKTKDIAWSPAPPRKNQKNETSDFKEGVKAIKRGRTSQSTKDALKMLEDY